MTTLKSSRRTFLKDAAIAAGALAAAGLPAGAAEPKRARPPVRLAQGSNIVFQGDSITDGGRHRTRQSPNNYAALGFNYPVLVSGGLLGANPKLKLNCYNRGVAGNKVPDLNARWKRDCLDLGPSLVSILIGVNDMLHKVAGVYKGTVKLYEKGYGDLLERTRRAVPKVILVVCEPFALRCGVVNEKWFPEFDEMRAAARRVAARAGATWVPLQKPLEDLISKNTPAGYWTPDGVHPTMPAQAVIARAWLEATGLG